MIEILTQVKLKLNKEVRSMSFKLTNISGGQIVCDLAVKGKTLRLDNKKSKTIPDNEMTSHIENMVSKRLLLSEKVSNETKTKKETAKTSSKEKEE